MSDSSHSLPQYPPSISGALPCDGPHKCHSNGDYHCRYCALSHGISFLTPSQMLAGVLAFDHIVMIDKRWRKFLELLDFTRGEITTTLDKINCIYPPTETTASEALDVDLAERIDNLCLENASVQPIPSGAVVGSMLGISKSVEEPEWRIELGNYLDVIEPNLFRKILTIWRKQVRYYEELLLSTVLYAIPSMGFENACAHLVKCTEHADGREHSVKKCLEAAKHAPDYHTEDDKDYPNEKL
ncbi:hypothetical protein FH972_024471 [Carpinus fangiana]|uniref:Uncharacterized protein n=1 Tax=Carpinus fangiana TaxID=176857 RepID=A0A5N6KYJ5_9ROSI|nr:hypothetical protein FH972_024471 [Carpinus fangiana]